MNETELYARLGRQAVAIEQERASYDALLRTLADVISGKTAPSRVMVNLTAGSWNVCPEAFSQAMPAQVNGLPACVVAPPQAESRTCPHCCREISSIVFPPDETPTEAAP